MKIKTKLRISGILPLGLSLIIILSLFLTARQVNEYKKQADLSDALAGDMISLNILLHEYLLYQEERQHAQWQLKYGSTAKLLTRLDFESQVERAILKTIRRDYKKTSDKFS
ncbi:MAG: hypothetical protein HZC45_02760 [Deltaproteobacteria bacterium]|nr:hypothetical protein [Deltaproteobacteria bacterium]